MFTKQLCRWLAAFFIALVMPVLIWAQPASAIELPDWFPFFKGEQSQTVSPSLAPSSLDQPLQPEDTLPEIVEDIEPGEVTKAVVPASDEPAPGSAAARFAAAEAAAPKFPLKEAFFGDTHVHTSYSPDAFSQSTRTTPQDAYDFAKGGAIQHAAGYTIQNKRPLDFYMVTDHSEYMGVLPQLLNPESPLQKTEIGKLISSPDPEKKSEAFIKIVVSVSNSQAIPEFVDPAVSKSIWQEIVETADNNYEPGKFTTFPAYEWTSLGPDARQNLHRNLIFRTSDAVPEIPFSSFDSIKPEDLWNFMDDLREDGVDLFAIPHNSNYSDGLMFPLEDSYGNPIDKEYAEQRMRNEPLVEITQIKGTSETNPLLSDTDEFAGFEISDFLIAGEQTGNLRGQAKGSYVRDAYRSGLVIEEETGVNPYKFGITAATDTHNSGGPIEEDNYFGKLGLEDGTPEERVTKSGPLGNWVRSWGASGVAAVWAESNTRDDIYDAMVRKESFATTGPLMRVRFFGGWNYTPTDASSNDFVKLGYEKGVSMGGDLAFKPDSAEAPTFMVAAMKDPIGANLDRIQVVKGWSKNGQSFEKVYDVALADGRKVDPATGKAPRVGNTVDPTNATYKNTIGDAQLSAYWADPDFDPTVRAFYYVRALEIPTPRWSTYDALELGITPPNPVSLQERAFTSPIWYTPTEELLEQGQEGALTIRSLKAQGAKELSTSDIKKLILGNQVKIKNIPTGEILDAFYRPDGQRTLMSQGTFASFHGGLGGTTNPYTIEDNMLSSSFDDGSQFSSRIFELNGNYYGAKSDEAGYVNYEVVAVD
jgi:hypothetical protein